MELNKYQEEAIRTAVYPNRGSNVEYPTLGLCGEAGEVANKVKKIQRDFGGRVTARYRIKIAEELGDVLWYLALCADEINLSLNTIAQMNIDKLSKRVSEGKLHGEGDNR